MENMIIEQTPVLEGLGITPKKMKGILETFGPKCLIILDGLDKIDIKNNEEIFEVLKGQRFLHCNFIVTSRPGRTTDVEEHFDTMIQVQGFTEKQAEIYVCRCLEKSGNVQRNLTFSFRKFHSLEIHVFLSNDAVIYLYPGEQWRY